MKTPQQLIGFGKGIFQLLYQLSTAETQCACRSAEPERGLGACRISPGRRFSFLCAGIVLLLLPGGGEYGEIPALEHTLQPDETLYSVARQYGVDVEGLMDLNGIDDPRKLRVNQVLAIPGTLREYQVKKGDTYYGIARKEGIPLHKLLELNGREEADPLLAGDVLMLPGEEGQGEAAGNPGALAAGEEAGPENSSASNPQSEEIPSMADTGGTRVRPPRYPAEGLLLRNSPEEGVVIRIDGNESIYSVHPGRIIWEGPFRGYGQVVLVEDGGGRIHIYGGAGRTHHQPGDVIRTGDVLGTAASGEIIRYAVFTGQEPIEVSLGKLRLLGE